jgi:hypothetical protein
VLNCGCLIPRRSIERGQVPHVGLLHEDGTITTQALDVSQDRWLDVAPEAERMENQGMDDFLRELGCLESDPHDFRDDVLRYVEDPRNDVGDGTRELILSILEGAKR